MGLFICSNSHSEVEGRNPEQGYDFNRYPDTQESLKDVSQKPSSPQHASGELIVKLKEGKTLEDLEELNAKNQPFDFPRSEVRDLSQGWYWAAYLYRTLWWAVWTPRTYQVTSVEKLFKPTPSAQETLAELKRKLSELESKEHQAWYWQLDKDSQEYKDYIKKSYV